MANARGIVTRVTFPVEDKIVVADPCYIDKDDVKRGLEFGQYSAVNGLMVVLDDCAGEWVATIDMGENKWDEGRVSILRAKRIGADTYDAKHEFFGMNGVDSGQMFVGCASSFPLDYEKLLEEYKDSNGEWQNLSMLAFSKGAVSSTGYGDGNYPVHVWYDRSGKPCKIEVRFMEEGEEEEDDA